MHFLFSPLRESRFCFRERHGLAFTRVSAVPLGNEKNAFSVFFSFARVTVLLSREARLCFRKSHGRASRKGKNKTRFFSFPRGTAMTLAEAHPCLSRKQNRDSRERKKNRKRIFSVFERHDRDSRESTTVHLTETKPWLSRKDKKQKMHFFRFR